MFRNSVIVLEDPPTNDRVEWFNSLGNPGVVNESEVAHMDVEIECTECILGHGASKFVKADKVAKLQREQNKGSGGVTVELLGSLKECVQQCFVFFS